MKAGRIATAALMLASVGISSAASARDYGYGRDDRGYSQRHDDRGYRDSRRYDDRRYYGHRNDRRWNGWRNDRRCWTEWRYHHRVRICR
ncbi:MAG: hypothetical protein V4530_15400 [Pseudomonadota bacterium]